MPKPMPKLCRRRRHNGTHVRRFVSIDFYLSLHHYALVCNPSNPPRLQGSGEGDINHRHRRLRRRRFAKQWSPPHAVRSEFYSWRGGSSMYCTVSSLLGWSDHVVSGLSSSYLVHLLWSQPYTYFTCEPWDVWTWRGVAWRGVLFLNLSGSPLPLLLLLPRPPHVPYYLYTTAL
jgi:hypothetical protein